MRARPFYTTKQIADLCGVHITTAIRWIDGGQLRAFRTPGGRRRVAAEEVRSFVERLNIPVKRKLRRETPLVLVVDDDPLVLRAIARQLKASGAYEVITAESGYDALLVVGSQLPDLVLVDLIMENMDGYELCGSIKRNPTTSHIAILAMTGKLTPTASRRATAEGAFACISKDEAADRLLTVIEDALS